MNKKRLLLFIIIVIFPFRLWAGERKEISIVDPKTNRKALAVADEILVKFKSGVEVRTIDEVNKRLEGKIKKKIEKIDVHCIKVPPHKTVLEMIEEYKKDPNVEYVEPNYIRKAYLLPSDPNCTESTQWGIFKIKAPQAWEKEKGSPDIVIAIVDTGVDYNHSDIKGNMWQDSNGYYGYDFVNFDEDPYDDNSFSHGTLCAGISAAVTDNNTGIAGVSWKSKIMAVKVLESDGTGADDDIANGIIYAADEGAEILNMSFGGPGSSSPLRDAVDYAYGQGCLLVAASGNDNRSSVDYPAAYENVIAVGATNENDERCSPIDWGSNLGSNYGTALDVVAPGNNIFSTIISGYGYADGTSMSAPFVSGLSALIWSHNPGLTNLDVKNIIISSADDIGTTGWDVYTGYGRINAEEALATFLAQEVVYNIMNFPNPFRPARSPQTTICFTTKGSVAEMRVDIYNLAGELVHSAPESEIFLEGIDPENRHIYKYRWDGRNDSGERVASGIYIFVVNADGDKKKGKLAVIK